MKNNYTSADIEIIYLKSPDVISTSGGDSWLGDDGKPNHDSNGWT